MCVDAAHENQPPAARSVAHQDAALAALAAGGDESAFGRLYDRYAPGVYALALRLTADQGLAEEITQETFLRLWRCAATLSAERGHISGWLLRVAYRLAIDHLRRCQRRPLVVAGLDDWCAQAVPDPGEDPAEEAWAGARREALLGLLAHLTTTQRQVIELTYFGGLTQAQVAARLGIPLGTVKSRLHLGLQKLRRLLQGQAPRLAA